MNNRTATIVASTTCVLTAVGLYAAASIGVARHETPVTHITVAACSLWADTSTPVLPANTATNRCLLPDGTVSYAK